MEAALEYCAGRELTNGVRFHPGAEHGQPDILKNELQLYGGNCLSSALEKTRIRQRA